MYDSSSTIIKCSNTTNVSTGTGTDATYCAACYATVGYVPVINADNSGISKAGGICIVNSRVYQMQVIYDSFLVNTAEQCTVLVVGVVYGHPCDFMPVAIEMPV